MTRLTFCILALVLFLVPVHGAEWAQYVNARFGLVIDIPPTFDGDALQPSNDDGMIFHSADEKTELLVWANFLGEKSFIEDTKDRLKADLELGWDISYERLTDKGWTVYSGTKVGRILYAKSLASCDGKVALHFRIDYPLDQKKLYDPIVTRLEKTLRPGPAVECS